MNLNLRDITFIIVTYKSEDVIKNCLDTLPKESKKIIIENSNNIDLKDDLKSKYDNIEVIVSKNVGMGAGNNIGLNICSTKYAYVINPDVRLYNDTIDNLIENIKSLSDFALASPLNANQNFPNYKNIISKINSNENILSVDTIDGFSMLFNLEKFKDKIFFDENYFLYLENDDLCFRIKKKNELIVIVTNSLIEHKGSISKNSNLEYLRNWHWMWSKFYFNKKHFGFFIAFLKIFSNLFSALIKFVFHALLFNFHKKNIYKMRIFGICNSILGKKSDFRIDN
tara:strand:- start:267 stop:1115 length:849 start_codon:yes stop_codon:yes gene_type:complete